MSIVKGQQGMVLRAVNRRYQPGSGWSTVYVYETGDKALAEQFGGSQANGVNGVDLDLVGPPYRVEVSAPDAGEGTSDEVFEDVWEVPPFDKDNKLLQIAEFQDLPDGIRQIIQDYSDGNSKFDEALDALKDAYGAGNVVPGLDAYEILLLLSKGSDSYPAPSSSLRWTRVVGKNYGAMSDAYANVNFVWSTATLLNSLPIPANYAAAVQAAANALPTPGAGYSKGWLKKQPTVTSRGSNKTEITQEWILEAYNDWLFFNV